MRERSGARTTVSYLLVAADSTADLSNFDRRYEHGAGERHGDSVLHRVKLWPYKEGGAPDRAASRLVPHRRRATPQTPAC
jgi:hypothetical protein